MNKILTFFAILFFSITVSAQNNDESEGKFSGYMFGDYYHITKSHKADILDKHGFWFRRIYFSYDYKINSNFSTRLRFEMSNEGDFTSKIAMIPFVKDAWLKYKLDNVQFILVYHLPQLLLLLKRYGAIDLLKKHLSIYKRWQAQEISVYQLKENLMIKELLNIT